MANNDWNGNSKSIYTTLGASNHVPEERAVDDFYATDPKAAELLCDLMDFNNNIWECACGSGCLSEVFKARGYNVYSTDLVDRGYGIGGVDFLQCTETFDGDIITNPPYSKAQQFVEKALELVPEGNKVVMFLKVQFLEGKARREMFDRTPPKLIYVSSSRLLCAKNAEFDKLSSSSSAVAYAWYIWEKGYTGDTVVKWFN
ncbi:MAG: hypothetical protein MJZ20_11540 [Bacteroidaceae bacterium]|nr:hypothetical protein [Bacteroidaceae bacterium]